MAPQFCEKRRGVSGDIVVLILPQSSLREMARRAKHAVVDEWQRRTLGRLYSPTRNNFDAKVHIREAAAWLMRAQDAGDDRGVSWGVRFTEDFRGSYPETTGYIIPTFLVLSDFCSDPCYLQRAIEMGDWEISVQMECGAVMGGIYNPNPTPAVFNTGQVLLGWAALYQATCEPRFLRAAQKASDWLVGIQEPSGEWIRFHSEFTDSPFCTYNVMAAWGLCAAGMAGNWKNAVNSALRHAEFTLTKQIPNGWYEDNCFTDSSQPLIHTIAYVMQGLLGIGNLTGRLDFIAAAQKTADSLIGVMNENGFIPGRLNREFRGTVPWCCLTGTAQTAICWAKLFELTGDEKYREACHRANRYLMACHDIENKDLSLRGGVTGSWPVWGEYGQYTILNWATNFFIAALLAGKRIGAS